MARLLHEGDTLEGGAVLPGCAVPVRELFELRGNHAGAGEQRPAVRRRQLPVLGAVQRHGGATVPLNSYTIPSAFPVEPDAAYSWRVRSRVQGDGAPGVAQPLALQDAVDGGMPPLAKTGRSMAYDAMLRPVLLLNTVAPDVPDAAAADRLE